MARFAFGVALLAPAGALAQTEAPSRSVTLAEARTYAREHQPAVRAALARIAAAQANARIPRAQWLPQLGATAQLFVGSANNTSGQYIASDYLDIPRIGGTSAVNSAGSSFQPYGSTFAAIGVTQEIFDFGRIEEQAAAADARVDASRHASDTTWLDIDYGVQEAFFGVLTARSILKASREAYDRTKVHRDLAEHGVTAGLYPPIELTRAEADLARFDIQVIRARGGVTARQAVLAASVGAPELLLDANGELPGAGALPTLADALREAAARDPRVAEALAKVRAQHAQTRAIYAEMRPDLTATATFSGRQGGAWNSTVPGTQEPDFNGWLPTVPNWDVGLVFTWPIFDPTVLARARASAAEEEVLRDTVDELKLSLAAAVQRAYIAVEVARDALPGLERSLTAAMANYAQADARFKAGLGTAIELADAEAVRTDAEIQLALGKFDLAKANAALERAIARGLVRQAQNG